MFYQRPDGAVMGVGVQSDPNLEVGIPQVLFAGPYRVESGRNFDIHPDGQRFLMVKEGAGNENPTQINIVLNWTAELAERVPAP